MAETESMQEILYETRFHASRPFTSNYPPQQSVDAGTAGSLFSRFMPSGVTGLKGRWSEYRNPKRLKKLVSLFSSPTGEYVAVAAANQITFLQKDDDYQNPCGIYINSSLITFTNGSWSENHNVFGAVDDTDMVYFIKPNGEEITRITNKDLKVSFPIIGLIAQDESDIPGSYMCSFSILTSDGSLHCVEVSQDPGASLSSSAALNNNRSVKGHLPKDVSCFDYHPERFLLATIGSSVRNSLISSGSSGSCYLSIVRKSMNLSLELLASTQLQGLYSVPKVFTSQLTYQKVLISPQGNFVATLDLAGSLRLFKLGLDGDSYSLSDMVCQERSDSCQGSHEPELFLSGIVDFTWWSDHILTLAKSSGILAMLDILSCNKLSESDLAHSMPVLDRVQNFHGRIFLLETTSAEKGPGSKTVELLNVNQVGEDRYNQLDIAGLQWKLISFYERSIPEMYRLLIRNQKYQEALEFANRHELDKDDVLKAQWLKSDQRTNQINKFLSKIRDELFVLSECVQKVGSTEDDMKALLAYGLRLTNKYKFSVSEDQQRSHVWEMRMIRLQLLQFRDRLETFLGINMGRFSVREYKKFRVKPIYEVGLGLAESGKIGALNLLFKRHPYSLSPSMLDILAAIPETIPVQSYGQLLPGRFPPATVAIRDNDWVECDEMISYINRISENNAAINHIKTEPVMKQYLGYVWPSIDQLSVWYKSRAVDIDSSSGQLDNCLYLVDFACRMGIHELQQLHEDISYLNEFIYANDNDGETSFNLSLVEWVQLSDYEKFKMMLQGVHEENVVERLRDKAIPFMKTRSDKETSVIDDNQGVTTNNLSMDISSTGSFLVKWLKEVASANKVSICLSVFEECCKDLYNGFFRSEVEAVDCALQCIYLCTATDKWNVLASIGSNLPQIQDTERCLEGLHKRIKLAEGHIEAGRLLAFYQVPKPINFFLEAHSDGKGVKQILRLILSKFSRRQPGRSDYDWANMWRDLQSLQEKAFPFLDLEYMLMEFCRGLLKAGKFPLARNYLKGTGSVSLTSEKAEKLVIQAGREYFFSAASLACSEIRKAKDCLNLLPNSINVKAEADIIDALTDRLPKLGVTLLPMQFRQITDTMEIIKMAIKSQAGAYLQVKEIIEIARLLGLRSQQEISVVEEAIAREAAVAGDLQSAFHLCLVLAKKGHGLVWDLCAAIAKGPPLENMDTSARKNLLGFALSHCDEESIGELLHAWKDIDMQGRCELLTETNYPKFLDQGSLFSSSLPVDSMQELFSNDGFDKFDQERHFNAVKITLSDVVKGLPAGNESDWDSFLRENGKLLSFAASKLPQLLELCKKGENAKKLVHGLLPWKQHVSVKMQAVITTLRWLAQNGFAPKDDFVALLAKSILEPPVTKEGDIQGCSFLLNLFDAVNGVEVIEEQLKTRQDYPQLCSIMNIGMTYSLLHNSIVECEGPGQRRELILKVFKEKHTMLKSDDIDHFGNEQSTFWREWKLKLEEQKLVADHSRVLEQIIPGVDVARFLSGDMNYIKNVVLALTDSVKLEKKCILANVLKLADTYGLHRTMVLQQFLASVLASEVWTEDDITAEISKFKEEIVACAELTIKTIYLDVYPSLDGRNKLRLAYLYNLLSDCHSQLKETRELSSMVFPEEVTVPIPRLDHYYKVLEQECGRVSFIKNLNFKHIAGLGGLNLNSFNSEIHYHIENNSVEALAKMVENLTGVYADQGPEGVISSQDVYKYHLLSLLGSLEDRARRVSDDETLLDYLSQIEQTYDLCRAYIRAVAPDTLDMMKRFFSVIVALDSCSENLPDTPMLRNCLVLLLNFWIRLTDEMKDIMYHESSQDIRKQELYSFDKCLRVFIRLVTEDCISSKQGWQTILLYLKIGFICDVSAQSFIFSQCMMFSGCGFKTIADVYYEAVSTCPALETNMVDNSGVDRNLSYLYSGILDKTLQYLVKESHVHQNLYKLVSSLSKLEGDLDDLKKVRHAVWEQMVKLSDNLDLPSHVRVFILELMQYIAGKVGRLVSTELHTNVVPWEGWDDLGRTRNIDEATAIDNSSRFDSTLVALRSSQLIANISPNLEIKPEDLVTVEAAVSCFIKLCRSALIETHCEALIAILVEWEGLFVTNKDDGKVSLEESDEENNWTNEGWDDDGWESFHDGKVGERKKNEEMEESPVTTIHPLHLCFLELLKRFVTLSQFEKAMEVIDKWLAKSNGVLLDEEDMCNLNLVVIGLDCFLALKLALLHPYQAIQFQCLGEVESKLKQEGIADNTGNDIEFLVLVLSSGITSAILTKSSYGTISSYLCYLVGNFARHCQESELAMLKEKGKRDQQEQKGETTLFRTILFPWFISELVMADQQVLAGFLVTKFMHVNPSLGLMNVAEATLRQYLNRQHQVIQDDNLNPVTTTNSREALRNTTASLWNRLGNVIESALSSLNNANVR